MNSTLEAKQAAMRIRTTNTPRKKRSARKSPVIAKPHPVKSLESTTAEIAKLTLARLCPPILPPAPETPLVLDVRPPVVTQNRARDAAYNREGDSVEALSLEENAAYQEILAHRRALQQAIDIGFAGIGSFENNFLAAEHTRKLGAAEMLRRGYQPSQIALSCGLTVQEVRELRGSR
jgi:hypothetical protein